MSIFIPTPSSGILKFYGCNFLFFLLSLWNRIVYTTLCVDIWIASHSHVMTKSGKHYLESHPIISYNPLLPQQREMPL
jgi:hypothetical protein